MINIRKVRGKFRANIEGEMSIYNAKEMKESLDSVMDGTHEVEINLSKVNEIDTVGVQLLMLVKKALAGNDQTLTLTEHSAAVVDVFELMGLVSYFNDPVVLPGRKGGKHES